MCRRKKSRYGESETGTESEYKQINVQCGENGQRDHQHKIFQPVTKREHGNIHGDGAAQKCGQKQFSVARAFFRRVGLRALFPLRLYQQKRIKVNRQNINGQ